MERDWPGNVRELENYIEKQFIISEDDLIDVSDAPPVPFPNARGTAEVMDGAFVLRGIPPLHDAVRQMENYLIDQAVRTCKSTYKAARLLGISQPTVYRKYKALYADARGNRGDKE
jgi:transcriptional regulator with PAS, ATPase and Fis domain